MCNCVPLSAALFEYWHSCEIAHAQLDGTQHANAVFVKVGIPFIGELADRADFADEKRDRVCFSDYACLANWKRHAHGLCDALVNGVCIRFSQSVVHGIRVCVCIILCFGVCE